MFVCRVALGSLKRDFSNIPTGEKKAGKKMLIIHFFFLSLASERVLRTYTIAILFFLKLRMWFLLKESVQSTKIKKTQDEIETQHNVKFNFLANLLFLFLLFWFRDKRERDCCF